MSLTDNWRKGIVGDRPDFFDYLLKAKGDRELIGDRLYQTGVVAGSETTAMLLMRWTWQLPNRPNCRAKTIEEVRAAFKSPDAINSFKQKAPRPKTTNSHSQKKYLI